MGAVTATHALSAATALPGPPGSDERMFGQQRRVQLGDVDAGGQLRLDALSRYLQDVADADAEDAGLLVAGGPWVLRRGHLRVTRWPDFREQVTLRTWCSGTGACWAERRTSLLGSAGDELVDTVTTWVHVDPSTARPRRIPSGMDAVFGGRAVSRHVDARLRLPTEPPADAETRPWPMRHADLDVMGHVNNAAALTPVVDVLNESGLDGAMTIDLEHRAALALSPTPTLEFAPVARGGLDAWVRQDGRAALVARVRANPRPSPAAAESGAPAEAGAR